MQPPPEEHKAGCDAGRKLQPPELVGREVQVWWPKDKAWYSGTVVQYYSSTVRSAWCANACCQCLLLQCITAVL
jgi:hypothetical protein